MMRVPFIAAIASAAIFASAASPALSKDLGVRGATWPVVEPDLLVQIEAHLMDLKQSGKLARLQDRARSRVRQSLEAPEPVAGIAPAREYRTRLFDPSITVAQDIRGPDGALIAAAGTRINPLVHAPLTRDLLFVDGRRPEEVARALANERPAKIVLLAGRPLDLARTHGRHFFFDLGGRLAERFGIVATPTLMTPEGALLRLTEVPVEDRNTLQSKPED